MKEVSKKIRRIKAKDGAVSLPSFSRLDDGNYVIDGTVDVSKMSEIRQYLKEYREISKLIRENYRKEISDIFHSALSELVGRVSPTGGYVQGVPFDSFNGDFNDVQFITRAAAGRGFSQKTIERLLTSDGVGVKRYKPGREIIDMMNASDASGYMVLPDMNENGVEVIPDKNANTISLRFKFFKEEDAAIIKNYLLSVADSIEDGDLCKKKIEDMFDTSREISRGVELQPHLLIRLGQEAVDLMGIDLSKFRKKPKTKIEPTTPDALEGEFDGDGLDGGDNYEDHTVYDEQGNGTDPASGKVTRIVVNGLNNLSQGINNGKIQVVLSPTDGFVYTVKLDGEELVAEQTPAEPSNE